MKYTLYMRWFMIFTDRCPLPSLGGEDLPKRHSPSLLYFTKEIPNTQPTKNNRKGDEDISFFCLCLCLLYSDSCLCKSWCHRCCPKGWKSMIHTVALPIKQTCFTSYHSWNLSQEHPISRSLDSRNLYPQLQVTRDLDTLQLNGVSPKRKRR